MAPCHVEQQNDAAFLALFPITKDTLGSLSPVGILLCSTFPRSPSNVDSHSGTALFATLRIVTKDNRPERYSESSLQCQQVDFTCIQLSERA